MKRTKSFALFTLVTTMAIGLLFPLHARAQITDAQIEELVREALKSTHPTFTFTPQEKEGPTVQLTEEQAVAAALEKNLELAVQRLTPQIQDIGVLSAKIALRQPILSSTVSRSSATSTPTNQLNLSASGGSVTQNTLNYNASIDQPLPFWGGTLSADFNNFRRDSNSNNSTFNPSYNSTWLVAYAQPLFRNREIDAGRRTLLTSEIQRDMSDVQLKQQISNLSADVRNAYWDFVFRTRSVETAQQSLDIATKLVNDNQIKVEVGTLAPIEVVQARAEQARMQQALVNAQNARRNAELALKALIVGGTDDPLWSARLDPIDRPEFRPETIDFNAAVRRALSERNDIAIAKKQIEANEVSMKFLRNATMPDVRLNVNYGVSGVGGTQLIRSQGGVLGSAISQVIPGGLGDAISQLLRADNPQWTFGMTVNYPIGLSTQDTALARARVQLNQNQANLKLIELQVTRDVTSAAINLQNTAEAVAVAQVSRELSEQRLAAEQSKFEVGMSTNYQVVQAQRDLAEARNSELSAILNYQRSQVEFDRVQQNGGSSGGGIITIN